MALKPACSIDELSLDEIVKDLTIVTAAYRKLRVARERRSRQGSPVNAEQESRRMKRKQRELNRHLLQNVVPAAKQLTYFKRINYEPKEMHFCTQPERLLGTRTFNVICVNRTYHNDLSLPSTLAHETVHILGAIGGEEALVALLGWEIDARLALAGFSRHKLSLYRGLQDMVFITSYYKAKAVGKLTRWKDFVEELYRNEITRQDIEEEVERLEQLEEGLFHNHSDYAIPPYLSIKGMILTDSHWVLEEYEYGGKIERERVELPTLIQIWKQLVIP